MLHLLLRIKLFTTESQIWRCSKPLYTWHAENFVFLFWRPLHYSGFILPAFPERGQAWESAWRSLLPLFWYPWLLLLSWGDPLEKETATHSSIHAWKIPWTEEPGGLQSMGSQRVGHDWATSVCVGWPPTPLAACPLSVSSSNFLSVLQLLLFFHQLLGMFLTAELVDTALSFKTQSSPSQSMQSWWDWGKIGWVETGPLREQAAQDVGSTVQLGTRNESPSCPALTIFLSCVSHRQLHTVIFPSFRFSFLQYILSTYVPRIMQNLSQINKNTITVNCSQSKHSCIPVRIAFMLFSIRFLCHTEVLNTLWILGRGSLLFSQQ